MSYLDYLVMFFYILGIFAVGALYGKRIKNTKDMFAAGGQSPWWVSGLSGFMTMFSAGTFVVWGGIAYKYGIIAVSINICYGIAALLTGYYVAGRWRKLGVTTPAEYLELRFGKAAIQFYTWIMMIYRLAGVAVALYSLAVVLTALMPLGAGNIFRDALTGNLDIVWAILLFGSVVVIYTMIGGLWAVLMTDVLQFLVLNMAVLFVIPLSFIDAGGFAEVVKTVPDGFFNLTGGGYTWLFLVGWVAIHFFMLGAEWAFVQRYLAVPSKKDARKSSYLFGILYIVSPILWLLPPLLYRSIEPNINPEEAYILACKNVLPAGMLGLMVAAMFSATASMVSSQLNVFAGVLTYDFYHKRFKPKATENHLVHTGRMITILLGIILIILAIMVPHLGGAEDVVISVTSLLVTPLLLPSVWGLFSKRITQNDIWPTAIISFGLGFIVKFGLISGGWFKNIENMNAMSDWISLNLRSLEIVVGVILPAVIMTALELRRSVVSEGWKRIDKLSALEEKHIEMQPSALPAKIVAWALGVCTLLMVVLWIIDQDIVLLLFGALMAIITGLSAWLAYRIKQEKVTIQT